MNWYTARCLFRSEHENASQRRDQLIEYRYFLLRAKDDKSARTKAAALAKKKEHSYKNALGTRVNWILEDVLDIKEILASRLAEGTEVYYKYSHRRPSKSNHRLG
jgi:Domain of unknown function (DUF4288)